MPLSCAVLGGPQISDGGLGRDRQFVMSEFLARAAQFGYFAPTRDNQQPVGFPRARNDADIAGRLDLVACPGLLQLHSSWVGSFVDDRFGDFQQLARLRPAGDEELVILLPLLSRLLENVRRDV